MTPRGLHWFVALAGVGLLSAGVVGAAREWSGKGLIFIFVAGVVCLLIALVAHRLVDVKVEQSKDGVFRVIFGLTEPLLTELKETGLSGVAATYAFVHNQLAEDPASLEVKIRLQDQLVDMVRKNSFNERVDAKRIEAALKRGAPAERVLAFGLLQADPTLATVPLLKLGIERSRSGNEQYYALLAAEARWPTLTPVEATELRQVIQDAPYLEADTDRRKVADRILAQ